MSFKVSDSSIYLHLADFLLSLSSFLKGSEEVTNLILSELKMISQSLIKVLLIPSYFDLKKENILSNAEEFNKFRNEYIVLYQNMYHFKSMKEFIAISLDSLFLNIVKNPKGVGLNEIELPCFLTLSLSSCFKEEDALFVGKLMDYIFAIEISLIDSELILLQYHEILIKYIPYYIADNNKIEKVLNIYMGAKYYSSLL